MSRIIQRCFLILAFTGVLLSSAEESTSSETSHSSPQQQTTETSPAAPELSTDAVVQPASSHSPVDRAENASSSHTASDNSSNFDATTRVVDDAPSETSSSSVSENENESTTTHVEVGSSEEAKKDQETTQASNDSQSKELYKSELYDAASNGEEISSEKSPDSSEKSPDSSEKSPVLSDKSTSDDSASESPDDKRQNASNTNISDTTSETGPNATSATSAVSEERMNTTTAAAFESTEKSTNNSGQSSVPSKEEVIYNSSRHVDEKQSPKEMSSTAPSKVQTEENGTGDSSKSATRKRSLNATNTATPVVDGEQISSSTTATELAIDTVEARSPGGIDRSGDAEVFVTMKQPVFVEASSDVHYVVKNKYVAATEIASTSFPHTIISAVPNSDVSAAHFREPGHVADVASPTGDIHVPPISSVALSTTSDESIHPPLDNFGTTAQAPSDGRGTPSDPPRSPELETEGETAVPTGHSYSSVTFDPDGMTHNFSQDPDSITFTPEVFHIDGMPAYGQLSRLEHGEALSHQPEVDQGRLFESTTDLPEILYSSPHETEGPYPPLERERESLPSSSHGMLPHDEPDVEEMYSSMVASSTTRHPEEATHTFPTSESIDVQTPGTPDSGKVILPMDDESEEMLNDSPHFVQIQSKPAAAVTTAAADVKSDYALKDLELNFSNDITHSVSSGPQTVSELADLSSDYHHTEQSEIRPVTAVSPLNSSESTTSFLPVTTVPLLAKSGRPDGVLPDTSSPMNLSNPAPTIANQSAETTTAAAPLTTTKATTVEALQSGISPQAANASDSSATENDQGTTSTNSTISGITVKTSVSVSIPLSNTVNDTAIDNSTVVPAETDANASSNASVVILPLPVPINKDADGHPAPTVARTEAATPSITESTRPRIRKPKLKFNSDDADTSPSPRTRKPFIAPLQKPSTTAGPPVSIFKKARTRIASITSSTTARPLPQFSTIRIHYASGLPPGMVPGGELVFSSEPVTTTVPTTTETEEPFSDEPFTEQTQGPIIPSEDDVQLIRVAGYIVLERGLRWNNQLDNRHSPQYKEKAKFVQMQLYRLFRTSPIATRLWNIEIDGFSIKKPKSVAVDFFLKLVRTPNEITMEQLTTVFHDKLRNNTFSRFTVDTNKTSFELLNYESIKPTTEPPEDEPEPVIPQWAIAVIVVGAASLIFIVLFAAVAILGRHHVRRRYSSKLNDEDDRPSDWESKMAAAYENLAADTIYDAEDLPSDSYKKRYHSSTNNGQPPRPRRADSWSSSDWSPPPRRPRPQVHRIVY